MRIGNERKQIEVDTGEVLRHYALSVKDTPTPVLCRWLRLPDHELLTGTGPVLAEPLTTGTSRLYLARFNEVAEAQSAASLRRCGASMLGVFVTAGACMLAGPALGAAATAIGTVVCAAIPLVYLGSVLRGKVELRALEAAVYLSDTYDDLDRASDTDAMAERYAKLFQDTLLEARTLGYVDERLLPACQQYVARYNEKFGDEYVVV